MKTLTKFLSLFIFAMLLSSTNSGNAQTAFTYQGQLSDGPTNANGNYALSFKLFDAADSGNQLGSTLSYPSHPIVSGLFTVNLDFGEHAFDGEAVWLEITVQGTDVLAPRVAVLPTPYAILAQTVADGAIDEDQLADEAVGQFNLRNGAVSTIKIEDEAISTEKLSNNAVTDEKIQSVSGSKIIGPIGGFNNTIIGFQNFIGGGNNNVVDSDSSAVVGGSGNSISDGGSFIGGGESNLVSSFHAAVAGGKNNQASGSRTFIGGGNSNIASGNNAVVVGGISNIASGENSFAAGNNASAAHPGSFVWASTTGAFSSTANNQFAASADGGFRFVTAGNGLTVDGKAATTGDEKLVIVRGSIQGDGTINQGTGFSVSLIPPGTGGTAASAAAASCFNGSDSFTMANDVRSLFPIGLWIKLGNDGNGFYKIRDTFLDSGVTTVQFMPAFSGTTGSYQPIKGMTLYPTYTITFSNAFAGSPVITLGGSGGWPYQQVPQAESFQHWEVYSDFSQQRTASSFGVIVSPGINVQPGLTYGGLPYGMGFEFIAVGTR